ncbi:hypothetical protein DPMN_084760 [Dreissena polymorpha]|uniref:Uncharacterized protein n=1 Tax=Dreissena polymorpha TaxID=45954 RepID=A0A9D4BL67_DREPO|nr:hypothetical protein DPMN_084760 [Dreissena polymorpha]
MDSTSFDISRDYPREISDARKQTWPDFKAALDKYGTKNVKMAFPAALVIHGETVTNAFPDWHSTLHYHLPTVQEITYYGKRVRDSCALLSMSNTTLLQHPETVTSIVLSCICLQNFQRLRDGYERASVADYVDSNRNIIPGQLRNDNRLIDGVSELFLT